MKLYRTRNGNYVEEGGSYYRVPESRWDVLVMHENLPDFLRSAIGGAAAATGFSSDLIEAPIGSQEVWAAGSTYYRSGVTGAAESIYDRVYAAERPSLFFKATAGRVAGPGEAVHIRRDAKRSVPEPELTVLFNARGEIVGYTAGNDLGSRDIEGENPLYLSQAKVYDRSCALGPCLLVSSEPLPPETPLRLEIERKGANVFHGATTLASLKRPIPEMAAYLFRETSFPCGVFLMTGTGAAPPADFALAAGDRVRVTVGSIGRLENTVAQAGPLPED